MRAAIELDVFQEMKLEENTGEIVMRPMAEMMDAPLDFIDEKDEPEWTPLVKVAGDFARKVEGLHTIDPKEYQERMERFKQGTFWPSEDHELNEEENENRL